MVISSWIGFKKKKKKKNSKHRRWGQVKEKILAHKPHVYPRCKAGERELWCTEEAPPLPRRAGPGTPAAGAAPWAAPGRRGCGEGRRQRDVSASAGGSGTQLAPRLVAAATGGLPRSRGHVGVRSPPSRCTRGFAEQVGADAACERPLHRSSALYRPLPRWGGFKHSTFCTLERTCTAKNPISLLRSTSLRNKLGSEICCFILFCFI